MEHNAAFQRQRGAVRRSLAEIYPHVVWSTHLREPCLVGVVDATARRVVAAEARSLGCEVLALDGVADHLHLLARIPGRLSAAELAKQIKGRSSRIINEELPDFESFRWQEGYGAFSVSRAHLRRVAAYVQQQEERHRSGDLWPEWERIDEEATE